MVHYKRWRMKCIQPWRWPYSRKSLANLSGVMIWSIFRFDIRPDGFPWGQHASRSLPRHGIAMRRSWPAGKRLIA